MRYLIFILPLFLALLSISDAITQSSPRKVVLAYCEADSAGMRTNSATWGEISGLITWDAEPGWDSSRIITGFELLQSHVEGDTAIVTIRYSLAGELNGAQLNSAGDAVEIVNFRLVEIEGRWRICAPVIKPHISVSSTVSRLKRALKKHSGKTNVDGHESVTKYFDDMKKTVDRLEDIKKRGRPHERPRADI